MSRELVLLIFLILGAPSVVVCCLIPNEYHISGVPFVKQETMWCGPASLTMVLNYWGDPVNQNEVGSAVDPEHDGTKPWHMISFLESRGYVVYDFDREGKVGKKVNEVVDELKIWVCHDYPIIVRQWTDLSKESGHYRVVVGYDAEKIYMVDPKYGSCTFTIEYFLQLWARNYEYGLIVIGDPTKDSDGDQLTDSNEIVQNTDPFDTDTDNDGLSDGEEINVYSTDPLEADMFHSFNTSLGYSIGIISNSTIEDFEYFKSNSTIKIHVSDMTANQTCGFCKLAIPHDVMSPPYNVTINDNPIAHTTVYENETLGLSIIYFSYDHSVLEITIVPEFPSFLILPLFMIATLLAVIVYRIKHQTRNKKREV